MSYPTHFSIQIHWVFWLSVLIGHILTTLSLFIEHLNKTYNLTVIFFTNSNKQQNYLSPNLLQFTKTPSSNSILKFSYSYSLMVFSSFKYFNHSNTSIIQSRISIKTHPLTLRRVRINAKQSKAVTKLSQIFSSIVAGMSLVIGANAPLLSGSKTSLKPATVSGAVFNVATSVIGAGIMSLPATLKVLGVIPAFVLVLVIALLAEISVEFLMRFTRSGETTTYSGVMREAFGPLGAAATQLCVVITNMGCLIMYLIIMGK